MSRSMFGWSYPPGAANDPSAPYNQVDPPCDVCGSPIDDCVCPECPRCHTLGNPECYTKHGMIMNAEQIAAKVVADEKQKQEETFWEEFGKTQPTE